MKHGVSGWGRNLSSRLKFALGADLACRKGCSSPKRGDGTSGSVAQLKHACRTAGSAPCIPQHLCHCPSAARDSPENSTGTE